MKRTLIDLTPEDEKIKKKSGLTWQEIFNLGVVETSKLTKEIENEKSLLLPKV